MLLPSCFHGLERKEREGVILRSSRTCLTLSTYSLITILLPLEAADLGGGNPCDPPRLWYLFRRAIATILHWTYRHLFPTSIDELLWGQV